MRTKLSFFPWLEMINVHFLFDIIIDPVYIIVITLIDWSIFKLMDDPLNQFFSTQQSLAGSEKNTSSD